MRATKRRLKDVDAWDEKDMHTRTQEERQGRGRGTRGEIKGKRGEEQIGDYKIKKKALTIVKCCTSSHFCCPIPMIKVAFDTHVPTLHVKLFVFCGFQPTRPLHSKGYKLLCRLAMSVALIDLPLIKGAS